MLKRAFNETYSIILVVLFAGFVVRLSCGEIVNHVIDTRTTHFTLFSNYVKDSFDIYISLPDNYNAGNSSYPVIYYVDANLKMGNA